MDRNCRLRRLAAFAIGVRQVWLLEVFLRSAFVAWTKAAGVICDSDRIDDVSPTLLDSDSSDVVCCDDPGPTLPLRRWSHP